MGWSLGANDAANIFGTAVGTKMIKFRTAAIICSIFVILGAVISGGGAAHTLGKLGSVNAIAGSFTVSFAAALTVFLMTKNGLPVSTSQAVVGAIIGWNLFAGEVTDLAVLTKILKTWVFTPILGAIFAILFYWITNLLLKKRKIHLLRLDNYTRLALVLVGVFGSYSLGANNIANVMGVFINVSPFRDISVYNLFKFNGVQQLFLLGGIAIAVGVFTYSKKVMMTVGSSIYKLSPITACIVVLSSSTVLFLFASEGLKMWLTARNLPSFPLVPVSQSQAVVGAILGIGIAKGGRNVNFKVLGRIGVGWVLTPLTAMLISYFTLAIMQNVFMQTVI
ncbi:inorganic phosphate transporter, PiT family [Anaerobranca californiensis DSM 14826]|uniref:Inorganic phosphate transporter, PiT family n=2 Tax=Anaerobranca TaxID=42447 RepID=A0A1M6RCD3_9FIRM|nr:inorganic phosphate transporter, PiT family [Anaerobranca californiensis DSM 14826]